MKKKNSQTARELLEQHGVRATEPRQAVLGLLQRSGKPMKAYDLIGKLSRPGHEVKPPTVYRALEALAEAGLVHRLESINAYVYCHGPAGGHDGNHEVVFAICDTCDKVTELEQDRGKLTQALRKEGFVPSRRVFEIHGACAGCKEE